MEAGLGLRDGKGPYCPGQVELKLSMGEGRRVHKCIIMYLSKLGGSVPPTRAWPTQTYSANGRPIFPLMYSSEFTTFSSS